MHMSGEATYTKTKKFSNSKPWLHLIYDKNSSTKMD